MKHQKNILIRIFSLTLLTILSAFIMIRAEYLDLSIQVYVFKPLTMIFIILIAIQLGVSHLSIYVYAILLGLLFSLIGDVFLMLPSDLFILGLISFLIAHLFYIVAFSFGKRFKFSFWSLLPFVLYGILMFGILSPYLGEMKLPVVAYIGVILIMGWQAFDRWNLTRDRFALLAFIGAVLFIFSDSVLALNKFREPFDIARVLNLSTYFFAQWLITLSIRQKLSR